MAVFVVGLIIAPRIGPTWDEPDNIHSGGVYWKFLSSGFNPQIFTDSDSKTASIYGDRIFTQKNDSGRYPPVPNVLGVAMTKLTVKFFALPETGRAIIAVFHLTTGIFFALLVAHVYRLGRLLGMSPAISLLTATLTFLYPTLFGHGFSNLKDIAQASLFTVSLYYLIIFTFKGDSLQGVAGAVVWGLAIATKLNAVYVPVIWGVWGLFMRKFGKLDQLVKFVLFIVIGLIVAFTAWPFLWFDPVNRALGVLNYFATVGQGFMLYWNGQSYQVGVSQGLWWYPWANLLLVTPLPLMLLGLVGLLTVVVKGLTRSAPTDRARMVLVFWLVIPLLRTFFPHAAFYDGIRHFLETLPAFMLLTGIGAETVLGKLPKMRLAGLSMRQIGKIGVTGLVFYLVFINFQYFPFSTGYLNLLAVNSNERFDRDIEGLAVKEGIDYLHARYGSIRLWMPLVRHLSWYYLEPGDYDAYRYADGQYAILINKKSHLVNSPELQDLQANFRQIAEIRRGPAVFGWVYEKIQK